MPIAHACRDLPPKRGGQDFGAQKPHKRLMLRENYLLPLAGLLSLIQSSDCSKRAMKSPDRVAERYC
jgi:hypothetical protein